MRITRRKFALLAGTALPAGLIAGRAARAAAPIKATLYKEPKCGCCDRYAQYLDRNGFKVDVHSTEKLPEISRNAGIPEALAGCHTMFVGNYVVSGLVPVQTVRKLLREKLSIIGITLPGMPHGAPGMRMPGEKAGPLTVYAIDKDGTPPRVFAVD